MVTKNILLYEDITRKIIGAAMEVHRVLGPGFLEGVYEEALCIELKNKGLMFKNQEELRIKYKDAVLNKKYRADVIVENKVIVDTKSCVCITEMDEAQMFNYLKTTGLKVGLIINFERKSLEWKRIICDVYFNDSPITADSINVNNFQSVKSV